MTGRNEPKPLALLPDNLAGCLARVRADLADSFGAPFRIDTFASDDWQPVDDIDSPSRDQWLLAD